MMRVMPGAALALALGLIGSGCNEIEHACPCGKISEGEVTFSGSPEVDGFFKALSSLDTAAAAIESQFAADVLAIGQAYGVKPGAVDAAYVAKVKKAVEAEHQAKLEGGAPQVIYTPPRCRSSVEVAIRASAECEAKAGCKVDAQCTGGELSFECRGQCSGSCDGTCKVPVCEIELDASAKCTAECHGTCEVTASGSCSGTCRGTCSGLCSAYDGAGKCAGQCHGTCTGTCETSVSGSCSGTCRGSCRLTGRAAANCKGELRCEGQCEGRCTGTCAGAIEAPRCSLDAKCNAEAKCEAQASAQASASLRCTPPTLEVRHVFKSGVTAKQKAEYFARLAVLERHVASIAQGRAAFDIFLKGDTKLGIEPVIPELLKEFQRLVTAVANGEVQINALRLHCVTPALQEAVALLSPTGDRSVPRRLSVTFAGQSTMMELVGQ